VSRRQLLRILDANFNRSREGLRVCEEIARFVLEHKTLTRELKAARHAVSRLFQKLPLTVSELVGARNVGSDVGRHASKLEAKRRDCLALFLANAERAKESLRALEETAKLIDAGAGAKFKKVRFKVYAIEKKALPRLEALRHHGR
jgi:thiamine-phosphate pyrophosphorylase